MAPSSIIGETWRSFWHAMTSNDRHATHDSPFRTGQHVPLSQSRNGTVSSVATSALESHTDLDSPTMIGSLSSNGHTSPMSPYSPGMRTAQRTVSNERGSLDKSPMTDIQMQNFSDGLPPPPPVSHSWTRIERWLDDNYGELLDNLCEGCSHNDVNELELELDCTLPLEVRESLQVHDGQERGGRPTGVVFGCMLLDCEEIVEEWQYWRAVNEQYLASRSVPPGLRATHIPIDTIAGPSSSSSPTTIEGPVAPAQAGSPASNGLWREELLGRQESQPPNAVQKTYAHASWIPLARDWGGNCIAIDLAPGPAGKWGQVIIFGRDYDCKFVVARSWGAFLATVADDLASGDKVCVDEETGELKLRQFKKQGVEPPYLEILRWRCDQRYGRRVPRKRTGPGGGGGGSGSASGGPVGGLRINPNLPGSAFENIGSTSPYASPTSAGSERGRSPQRFGGKSQACASPLRPLISSPLARVAEEAPPPISVRTDLEPSKGPSSGRVNDKLISIDTPRPSGDFPSAAGLGSEPSPKKENREPNSDSREAKASNSGIKEKEASDEMKTVII